MDRGFAERKVKAEQAAEQARIEEEEQAEKDLAIATLEDDRGDPPRPLDRDELEDVLAYYCGVCHAPVDPNLWQGEAPSNPPFENVEDLIALKKIIPGDAATSRIFERIQAEDEAHPMPPVRSGVPAVPPATVQLMVDFVDSLPADASD